MANNIYKIIGNNIKKYRIMNNISQLQLSELSGYSHEYIRRIESKKSSNGFSIEALYFISSALKINISNLFEGVKIYE